MFFKFDFRSELRVRKVIFVIDVSFIVSYITKQVNGLICIWKNNRKCRKFLIFA